MQLCFDDIWGNTWAKMLYISERERKGSWLQLLALYCNKTDNKRSSIWNKACDCGRDKISQRKGADKKLESRNCRGPVIDFLSLSIFSFPLNKLVVSIESNMIESDLVSLFFLVALMNLPRWVVGSHEHDGPGDELLVPMNMMGPGTARRKEGRR